MGIEPIAASSRVSASGGLNCPVRLAYDFSDMSDVIIAMYGRSPGDVHLQYARSKEVWREVSRLLEP
jgi:hypothetical protein